MVWEIEIRDGVAIVTMNSNKTNCINFKFIKDGMDALDAIERDHPLIPIVLTSHSPNTFSSGMDLQEVFKANTPEKLGKLFGEFGVFLQRFLNYCGRTVGAISGNALAGGLIIALACDYRVCIDSETAKFGLNEITIGIPFPVSLEMVNFKIGTKNTWEVALGSRIFGAKKALHYGIVDCLVSSGDLMKTCIKEATIIRQDAMLAYATTKRALLEPVVEQTRKEQEIRIAECHKVINSEGSKKIMMEIYTNMMKQKSKL